MKNAARLKVTRTRAVDRLPKAIVNDLKATRYTRRALHGRPLEPVSSKKFRGERFRIALDNSNRPLSENNSKFASDPTTFFEGAIDDRVARARGEVRSGDRQVTFNDATKTD